ncbi:MAG: 5-methyltetrahydropteroyltriglutamate--homocysteine S-methyltransferase [Rhodospirillaceae bacterium]|nr:5-methyltetrahydropteroyltriglutamate--homocysteine S-methyltransferase [Rhodospirillaceae bacterium]
MTPPFRADHIGSLLRPKDLTQAYRARSEGKMTEAELAAARDEAVRKVVALQQDLGLKVVTDGEFRRASYWSHWIDAIEGLSVGESLFKFHDERGNEQTFICPVCKGKLKKTSPISTEEFKFLKSVATAEPKITMPSPSTFHFWRGRRGLEGSPYATAEAFFDDLCAIYRQEIADLAALGCRYVQLDEVALIMLADPDVRAKVKARGEDDPDALISLYIKAMNDAVRDRPEGMTVAMHICRGNFKGKWMAEAGYDAIAARVFREVDVDAFALEYDTARAGDFKPLAEVPKGKSVILGLVSTKTPDLESADALVKRIEDAARYVPKDHLCLSPQCGFASTVAGNPVTIEDEEKKLKLIVDVAKKVWGEA